MSLRIVMLLFALALAIAGAWLVHQSSTMPEWIDEQKAMAVQSWNPPLEDTGPRVEAYNKRWVKAINALRSEKWPYYDAGATMIAFAVCLAAALLVLRINTLGDIPKLETPQHAWSIYALGIGGWFLYWTSAILALVEGFDRFQFPPWSDSQLTLIIVMACFAAISAVVLAVVAFLILRKSNLPAPLWVWRRDMPGHDWFYTIGAGLALLIGVEVLYQTYCFGHWLAVPSVFLCVYATLAMRAAGIAKTI
jgi:hypothetical protein